MCGRHFNSRTLSSFSTADNEYQLVPRGSGHVFEEGATPAREPWGGVWCGVTGGGGGGAVEPGVKHV